MAATPRPLPEGHQPHGMVALGQSDFLQHGAGLPVRPPAHATEGVFAAERLQSHGVAASVFLVDAVTRLRRFKEGEMGPRLSIQEWHRHRVRARRRGGTWCRAAAETVTCRTFLVIVAKFKFTSSF